MGSVARGCTPTWNSGLVGIHCLLLLQSNCTQRHPLSCLESSLASTLCLLIYTLEARQPRRTATQCASTSEEPVQSPMASHCCCLKSPDSPLRKMVCIQNLMGELVTHALPSVPNSCSLSVLQPLSAARQSCRLVGVPAQGLAPKISVRKGTLLQRTHSE